MGRNQISSSGSRKKRDSGRKNKWQKIQEAKMKTKNLSVVIQNAEFLSKPQLKKMIKQPTNSIRPSGKKKRKLLKRIGHQKREDRKMEVEVVEEQLTKNKLKKGKVVNMGIDETVDGDDGDSNEEVEMKL